MSFRDQVRRLDAHEPHVFQATAHGLAIHPTQPAEQPLHPQTIPLRMRARRPEQKRPVAATQVDIDGLLQRKYRAPIQRFEPVVRFEDERSAYRGRRTLRAGSRLCGLHSSSVLAESARDKQLACAGNDDQSARRPVFQDRIRHGGEVGVDRLQVRQHIEVNGARLERLLEAFLQTAKMAVAQLALQFVDAGVCAGAIAPARILSWLANAEIAISKVLQHLLEKTRPIPPTLPSKSPRAT
jgi:hypothetical protein